MSEKTVSTSQSLFQTYYLGQTAVDRRCPTSVMPWIIEELKLHAETMRFVWLTPGPNGVSYVADNGQELFSHTYSNLIRYCIASDRISFAYITQQDTTNNYSCHVFQALTYEEADMIMNQLRANVKPDLLPHTSNIGSSGIANASNKPTGEDNLIENCPKSRIRTNSAPPQTKTSTIEFHLRYIGSMEISHSSITEKFLNTTAAKFREAYSKKQKEKKKKKRKTIKTQSFTTLNSPGTISLCSFDSVDFPISEPPQSVTRDVPESSKYVLPTSAEEAGSPKGEGQAITVEVTRATPERDEKLLANKEGIETFQNGENDSGITTDDGVTEPTANEPTSSERGCEQVGEEEESQALPKDEKAAEETDGSAEYREPQRPHSLCTEEVMVMMGSQNYQDKEDDMGEEEEQEIVDSVAAITVRKRSLTVVPSRNAESEEDKSVTSAGAQDNEALAQDTQPSQEKEQEEGEKEQEKKPMEGKKGEEVVADNFDTLPELDALHDSPEFQKLGIPKDLPGRRVCLVISGFSVTIHSVNSGEQLLWKPIKQIACCIQGRKEPAFMGFSCREHGEKGFRFHLLRAEDKEMASKVLESFKSVFANALAATRPSSTLCDACPLQQLHELCQSIEGASVPVAQSRIQECLVTLSEADYAQVMKKLKESELVDHDYTQMVALVAILRQHFQSKQKNHTHLSVRTTEKQLSQSANTNKGRLSALERAKMALASSFDNLRTRKQLKKVGSEDIPDRRSATPEPQGSQSLNLPSNGSPTFSKKLSVSSLTAPGETAPNGKEIELKRSWSGSGGSFRLRRRRNLKKAASDEATEEEKRKTQSDSDDKRTNSEQEQSSMSKENGDIHHAQSAPFSSIPPSLQSSTLSPPLSPLLSSSRPGAKVLESKSFPSHVFRTPTHSPIRTRRSVRPHHRRKAKKDDPLHRMQFTPSPPPPPVLPPMFLRGHQRSMSLRQDIYESVSTPTKTERKASIDDFEWIDPPPIDQLGGGRTAEVREHEDGKMSPHTRIRKRWKSAIQQQILLNRMDKENLLFEKAATEADEKRRKLCYKDPSLSPNDATQAWNTVLNRDKPSTQDVHNALMLGVPLSRRGEVWRFLIKQYQVQGRGMDCDLPSSTSQKSFQELCEEDTEYKHSIQADIGRTFPSHPYFSKGAKEGQSSLYSILHAYAVADPEIGYCQGLSFLTGMLLMHSKDDEGAFEFLCQLMLVYDYRDVFAEDLSTLQVRLYQLSRLLHDLAPDLYQHFQELEVTPFLYAAPWFLTIFASQFPIAFVARVLDFFFYEGPGFVFKIALSLLIHHTEALLQCNTMESICIYLKNKLPEEILSNMSNILEHALKLDFGNRLQVFETEYRVMEELTVSFPVELDAPDVEALNRVLTKQNRALLEQLAICHGAIRSLTDTVLELQQKVEAQAEAQVPGPRVDRLGAGTLDHQPSDEKE